MDSFIIDLSGLFISPRKIRCMNPYLRLTRPSVCLMSILAILVGSVVSGVTDPVLVLLAAAAAFLITGAGNAVNDYFDIETDRVSNLHRPLPSGKLRPRDALRYSALLNVAGLVLSFLVGIPFLAIALLNVAVSSFYAWKLKKTPLLGNAAVSYLGASAFLAAGLIQGLPGLPIFALALIAFLGTMSREILKDIRDVPGDRKIGASTLPIVMGERTSRLIAFALLYLGCVLLLLPLPLFSPLYLAGAVPAVLACITAALMPSTKAEKLIKAAVFLVFLGFVLGSL